MKPRSVTTSTIAVAAIILVALSLGVGQAAATDPECFGQPATILGTTGPDEIHGTEGDDVIYADAGNDVVYGYGGTDRICGGPDIDAINGGAGNDFLDGNDGLADQAQYWSAPARVIASLPNQYADGGDGRDTLLGFERLVGSRFDDWLIGDARDNSFIGLLGADTILGGPGNDSVKYNWLPDPVVVDLLHGSARGQGTDVLTAIESVIGTTGNDVITGDLGDNTLSGLAGADVIDGLAGNDALEGGSDRDHLDGGPGTDRLNGEDGDDELDGGPGYDGVGGPVDAGDILVGGNGRDWATYHSHRRGVWVTLDGAANDGVASHSENDNVMTDVEDVTGTPFGDVLVGSDVANRLFGTEGDDFLFGHAGNDALVGEAGSDWLYGEAGLADVIFARDGDTDNRIDCGSDAGFAWIDSVDPAPHSCTVL
jgi:Ca2+-binding RTX toxin-like protein